MNFKPGLNRCQYLKKGKGLKILVYGSQRIYLLLGLNLNMKEDFGLEQVLGWILHWSRRRLSQQSHIQPLLKPQALLILQSVACGIILPILAMQPKRGTCSTSCGVSLKLYHRSHQQQHFCLFLAIHSVQNLKKSHSFSKEPTNPY